MVLHYANQERDDIIMFATKMVKYSIKNISGNIKAMFLKLGARNIDHNRNKMPGHSFDARLN